MNQHVVIVGAGAAGTAAATELRRIDFAGAVTLVNGEQDAPYNRTTVNKTLLEPDADLASVRQLVPTDTATTMLTGVRAAGIDAAARMVSLDDGSTLAYDALLVASGASPTALDVPVPPEVSGRVTTLRTATDAARIRGVLEVVRRDHGRHARVIVAGGSLLGSETADGLQALGHDVQLVDPAPVPLARLLGPTIGSWVRDQHRTHLSGVHTDRIHSLASDRNGGLLAELAAGTLLGADLLVVAAGSAAEVGWLAGLPVAPTEGVSTDDRLRASSLPGLYAAGDVARVAGGMRGEHWGQALAQGAHVARTIVHDLGLGDDPGAFAGASSYATRLYGKPISVVGAPDAASGAVDLAHHGDGGVHVTAFVTPDDAVEGLVTVGPPKVANKLRPLVAARATRAEAVGLLASFSVGAR